MQRIPVFQVRIPERAPRRSSVFRPFEVGKMSMNISGNKLCMQRGNGIGVALNPAVITKEAIEVPLHYSWPLCVQIVPFC